METFEMIQSRKAIREYSGQITDEQLNNILIAANAGSAGMNEFENYRLTVIQKPEILSQLTGIYGAPTVIVVSSTDDNVMAGNSAGTIVHGMELEAENQGLGANYNMACLGSIPVGVVPDAFQPIFAITLGQTTEKFTHREIPLDKFKTNFVK
ncbi:nitroreductase family protein [Companilactobacillus kimchiensis]|uniref:Nitroreductase n=1 Tax=Companilactobacillus kimchiensis TaxID=993692 RepID=A0A0R2LAF8_9LACO|nr:nitroreductase [Companilactobacillus kimchiensis]KRN98841.1 nitroreductase [Companilactobacillus kimchiensis]